MKSDRKSQLIWLASIVLALLTSLLLIFWQERKLQNEQRSLLLAQANQQLDIISQRLQQLYQAGQTATELLTSTDTTRTHNAFEHYAPFVLSTHDHFDFVALIERASPAQRQEMEQRQGLGIREFREGKLVNAAPRQAYFVATLQHPDDGKALPARLDLGAEPGTLAILRQLGTSGQPAITRIRAGNLQRTVLFFTPKASPQPVLILFGINTDTLLASLIRAGNAEQPLRLRITIAGQAQPLFDSHPGMADPRLPLLSATRTLGSQRLSFQLSTLSATTPLPTHTLPLAIGMLLSLGLLVLGTRRYQRDNRHEIHRQQAALALQQHSQHSLQLQLAQQRQQIRALQQAETRARSLLHDATDGMLLLDQQGQVLDVNPAAAELIGQPRDSLLHLPAGALVSELHHPDTLHFADHVAQMLGKPFEAMLICDQSFMLQVELSLSLCHIADEAPRYLVVCRNIAARKEREAALIRLKDSLAEQVETQRRQLTALLDASPMAMAYIVDRQFKKVNKAFLELFIREEDDIVDQSTRLIYDSDEHYLRTGRLIYPLLYQGQVTQNTLRLQRGNGTALWVNMYGRAVKPDTPGLGSVWLYQDISTQRSTEEALRQARDLAEENSRAKTEFLANMSHELRTPLHAILGFAEMGEARSHGGDGNKIAHYFERIHNSGSRLLSLLNDLLDLAKMEVGKMDYQFGPHDLEQVVREAVEDLRGQAGKHGVSLVMLAAPQAMVAEIDPFRIGQVMRNLLSNAIKFSPKSSRVDIGFSLSHAPDAPLSITVRDHGPGVPPGEQARIFDKFIQSSLTKTGAGGTGLGLAISREIVLAHHGLLSVHNAADGGAIFSLTLPRRQGDKHKEN